MFVEKFYFSINFIIACIINMANSRRSQVVDLTSDDEAAWTLDLNMGDESISTAKEIKKRPVKTKIEKCDTDPVSGINPGKKRKTTNIKNEITMDLPEEEVLDEGWLKQQQLLYHEFSSQAEAKYSTSTSSLLPSTLSSNVLPQEVKGKTQSHEVNTNTQLLTQNPANKTVESVPTYVVEMSKSGRSKCARCEEMIQNKTPRCKVMYPRAMFSSTQHLTCTVFDPSVQVAESIDGYFSLPPDMQALVIDRLRVSPDEHRLMQEKVDPDDLVRHEWSEQVEPPATLLMPLLPYQKEGLAWMLSKENSTTRGGMLADEMGMGKTIQTISLLLAHPRPKPASTSVVQTAVGSLLEEAHAAEAAVEATWTQSEEEHARAEQGSIYWTGLKRAKADPLGGVDGEIALSAQPNEVSVIAPSDATSSEAHMATAAVEANESAPKKSRKRATKPKESEQGTSNETEAEATAAEANENTPKKSRKRATKTTEPESPPELVAVTVKPLLRGGTLLILPTVAIRQWQAEITRFTLEGSMTVQVYHGSDRQTSLTKLVATDVVITSYKIVESEYRKATAGTKVTCRLCKRRFYPDKLRVHRRYFCGDTAQRTEGQSKTIKKTKNAAGDEDDEEGDGAEDIPEDISTSASDTENNVDEIDISSAESDDEPRTAMGAQTASGPNTSCSSPRSTDMSEEKTANGSVLPSLEQVLAQQPGVLPRAVGRAMKTTKPSVPSRNKGQSPGKGKVARPLGDGDYSGRSSASDSEDDSDEELDKLKKKPRKRPQKTSDTKSPSASQSVKPKTASAQVSAAGEAADWVDEEVEKDIRRALRASRRASGGAAVAESSLHKISWFRIVLDEAHNIKDRSTSTAKSVFNLTSLYKWCLSGTPLQNRVGELYSQVRFLRFNPHAYYTCKTKGCHCKSLHYRFERGMCMCCGHSAMQHFCYFNKEILNPIKRYGYVDLGKKALGKLKREILDEILLRRTKQTRAEDIQLPPRIVRVRRERLDAQEEDFYAAIYSQSRAQFSTYVASGTVLNNYANIFEVLMRLRQAIDHPYLVIHSGTQHDAGLRAISAANMQRRKQERQEQLTVELAETLCALCKDQVEDARRATCGCIFCCTCISDYIDTTTNTASSDRAYATAAQRADSALSKSEKSSHKNKTGNKKAAKQVTVCPSCSAPLSIDIEAVLDLDTLETQLQLATGRPTATAGRDSISTNSASSAHPGAYASVQTSLLTAQHLGRRRKSILDKVDLTEFRSSTKVEALMQELHAMQHKDLGAKAIVFSQFTSMLDIIQYRISSDRFSSGYDTTNSNTNMSSGHAPPLRCAMLMGNMSIDQRDNIVREFNSNPQLKVLLISLKAGGVALNLTVASHIFIMDPAAEM